MSDLIEHVKELRRCWDERHTRSWAAAATLTMQAHLGEIEILARHFTPDRSGEAGETPKSGSTEGESGLPEGSSK